MAISFSQDAPKIVRVHFLTQLFTIKKDREILTRPFTDFHAHPGNYHVTCTACVHFPIRLYEGHMHQVIVPEKHIWPS